MKVLIVDDDAFVRKLCLEILAMRNHEGECVSNVNDAFERLGKYRPDLIIMDIVMPGIDGERATRMFKRDLRIKDIPILVISGQNDQSLFERIESLGAGAYLRKPFKPEELVETAERLVAKQANKS